MIKDKPLLTGFVVAILAAVLGFVHRIIGIDISLDFLTDGDLTLSELIGYVVQILQWLTAGAMVFSKAVRDSVKDAAASVTSAKRVNEL